MYWLGQAAVYFNYLNPFSQLTFNSLGNVAPWIPVHAIGPFSTDFPATVRTFCGLVVNHRGLRLVYSSSSWQTRYPPLPPDPLRPEIRSELSDSDRLSNPLEAFQIRMLIHELTTQNRNS